MGERRAVERQFAQCAADRLAHGRLTRELHEGRLAHRDGEHELGCIGPADREGRQVDRRLRRGRHDLAQHGPAGCGGQIFAAAGLCKGGEHFAFDLAREAIGGGGQGACVFGGIAVTAQHPVEFADQHTDSGAGEDAEPLHRQRETRVVHRRTQRLLQSVRRAGGGVDQFDLELAGIEQRGEARLQRAREPGAEPREIARDVDRLERVRQQLLAVLRGPGASGRRGFDHWMISERK